MRTTRLPQELIDLAHRCGLAGRHVYIPKQSKARTSESPSLVASHAIKAVREVEATYEQRGVTFYVEPSPRKMFSSMFGGSRMATRFHLKLRTATRVVSMAYQLWRDWFARSERPRLDQLRGLADVNQCEYTALFLTYLEIRQRQRMGQEVRIGEYKDYHGVPTETIQQVIDLARVSIESCSWRSS